MSFFTSHLIGTSIRGTEFFVLVIFDGIDLSTGHSKLNNHQSKINKEISNLCDKCNIPEDLNHYLFVCQKFDAEWIQLQEKVEEILHREDANHIANIDMKVLTGMVEDISREAGHNLVGALMEFIRNRSSKRFALGFIFLSPPFSPIRFFCAIFLNLEPDFWPFFAKK